MKVIVKNLCIGDWNYLDEDSDLINSFIDKTLNENKGYILENINIVPPSCDTHITTTYSNDKTTQYDSPMTYEVNGKIIIYLKQTPLHKSLNP